MPAELRQWIFAGHLTLRPYDSSKPPNFFKASSAQDLFVFFKTRCIALFGGPTFRLRFFSEFRDWKSAAG